MPEGALSCKYGVSIKSKVMNTLILYDSYFGNTQRIAEVIGSSLAMADRVRLKQVKDGRLADLKGTDLLIIGAPTRGFRPSPATLEFLNKLPDGALENIMVAAFDTRIALQHIKSGILRFIVKTGGFAAGVIESRMKKKGGWVIIPAEGFCVTDTEGPLLDGELDRAADWAIRIGEKMATPVL